MKVIITGGMGFIFSHVTEHFLEKGYEVHVIDDLMVGSHPELLPELNKNPLFHFHKQNVSNKAISALIGNIDPEYIIHAAAISDVDYSIDRAQHTVEMNNTATLNVFESALRCPSLKRLLYISTDEVYGECSYPKKEDEILFPKNPYALSKAFGSLVRLTYDNTYRNLKDKTCETRFCNVFGPRQDSRKILPAIKEAIETGKPLKLHNGGAGYRQYIYVKEIPPLVETILTKGNRTYNITSGVGYTVLQLIEFCERITGKKVPIIPATRSGMDLRYEMSSERLEKKFKWKPSFNFEESLKDYLLTK